MHASSLALLMMYNFLQISFYNISKLKVFSFTSITVGVTTLRKKIVDLTMATYYEQFSSQYFLLNILEFMAQTNLS